MIPERLRAHLEPLTGAIEGVQRVGGGCIANATRLEAAQGRFFLKWSVGEAGRSFGAEAEGLGALAQAAPDDIVVPEALAAQDAEPNAPGFLLLDWLEPGTPSAADARRFGAALASLHRAEVPRGDAGAYGWSADNWIGSKPQRNGWFVHWPTFFGEQRLRAQAETVRQRGAWNALWDGPLDRLIARLPEMLPAAPQPSLLHGDLWAGNALALADGRFALIDPAVYVGHRETDLAMMELFGGLGAVLPGYHEVWPSKGYPERRAIYQLFHLINHLTHGPGYAGQVDAILRHFR